MSQVLNEKPIESYAQAVINDGFCIVPGLFPAQVMDEWNRAFQPLLERHIALEGHKQNRGKARYYVTLPFIAPFTNLEIIDNDTVLAIVEKLVGKDGVMCQLATDTPLAGSEYQEIHRDTQLLFPETGQETPAYQLAVNFSLVDVTPENGPLELTYGTHMLSKAEGLRRIESGETRLEPVFMKKGDVMIRDVRHLHRGTPNRNGIPRPMVVIGYSRRWLFRPEVDIKIPRASYEGLSARAKFWLRFNPVVESLDEVERTEKYQSFAY
ncbi:MAG: hypothetical protein JWP00_2067 [Chloroflexi bacterium]|jgi:ectoine hydroxylase-related dioxygenase (phytanoyl-CoA dioxygenase family)|nr:hypothetical protein [Chloroflexota bacterium]